MSMPCQGAAQPALATLSYPVCGGQAQGWLFRIVHLQTSPARDLCLASPVRPPAQFMIKSL